MPGKELELSLRFLTNEQIGEFSRDLRILLATNGTLTRTLGILVRDEIFTEIIDQDIHTHALEITNPAEHFDGQTLCRKVLLKSRSSRKVFVVAESNVAIDIVPSKFIDNLLEMDSPIGETLLAHGIELFKEAPKIWMDTLPDWSKRDQYQDTSQEAVVRRYRMTISSRPAIVITEYFPLNMFIDDSETAIIGTNGEGNGTDTALVNPECSCKETVRQQKANG